MSWILFAILAACVWAVVNVADKVIISRLTSEPAVPVILLNTVGIFVACGIFFVRGMPHVTFALVGIISVLGLFAVLPSYCYFTAAKYEEISRIVPLYELSGFFTAVIAPFTLHEVFNLQTYVSIVLMVIGALLISSKRLFPMHLNKPFWIMIVAAFTYAVYSIILKYLLQFLSFWDLFAAMRVATFLLSLPLLVWHRASIQELIRDYGGAGVALISLNQLLSISGVFIHAIATSLGPITLVNALTSVKPLLVLVFSILVTGVAPHLLKEEINSKTIARKFIATIFILAGAWGIA